MSPEPDTSSSLAPITPPTPLTSPTSYPIEWLLGFPEVASSRISLEGRGNEFGYRGNVYKSRGAPSAAGGSGWMIHQPPGVYPSPGGDWLTPGGNIYR